MLASLLILFGAGIFGFSVNSIGMILTEYEKKGEEHK